MRRLLITLFAVTTLGLGGALAQDSQVELGNDMWGGVSFGVPFGVNFHVGMEDLLSDGVDLRANVSAGFTGVFGIGADVLFDLPVDTGDAAIDVYAGGGLAVTFGGGSSNFGVGLLVGGEYLLIDAGLPQGGIFAEVGPAIGFNGSFGVNAKLGFNYHF